jgi:hypothetical protein
MLASIQLFNWHEINKRGIHMKNFLIGLSALALAATPAHAVLLYGIDDANNLIKFNSAAPGTTLSTVGVTGLGGNSLLAIDLRVRDGLVYGLTDKESVVSIDTNSGATSLVLDVELTGSSYAFDFNPTNANLRIVSEDNSNGFLRLSAPPIAFVVQASAAYALGTTGLVDPDIVSAAYTFNDNDTATGTTLFVLDSANDILATLNVATGVLTQVGALGVDIDGSTSFDIHGRSMGFVQAGDTLYRINLASGALSSIGNTDRRLVGITAVPEPAVWTLLIAAFGAAAGLGRRRRQPKQVAAQ